MWRGQCTTHTLLRSIKRPARSLPVFSESLLSPQGWGVQRSEQLCRWGSIQHIKGLKVGQTWLEDLLSVKLTLHFPSFFFPSPRLVRILTAEPSVIAHIVTAWLILPEKSFCQHLDLSVKPQCLLQLEWEIVTLGRQAPEHNSKAALKRDHCRFHKPRLNL